MAEINLATVLNQSGGAALVEEYLDKEFLDRREWNTPMLSPAYAQSRPLSYHEGQYTRYTRKNRIRRPEHMATPSGDGSDPASGATLGTNQILVPIEWIHEYAGISTVGKLTSWIDLEQWVKEDMPVALKRRANELIQNAMMVGRMTPGLYAADGTLTTSFDASAEATPTLYGISFTFQSCPHYYGSGKATFADMDADTRLTWADIRSARTKLSLSGASPISGAGMVVVLSESMWNDLLMDNDQGRLDAAIKGGFSKAIKGLEMFDTFHYAGCTFVIEDNPFTEDFGAENVRANYGPIHSAFMFGTGCIGTMPLGGNSPMKPQFKVQDITKTGYQKTIGYLIPWQTAVINPNWGCVIKSPVSESKPNNYDGANPTAQLDGFGV